MVSKGFYMLVNEAANTWWHWRETSIFKAIITGRGGHLVHFKNNTWHNIWRIKFVCHKIYKRIPNNEGFIKSR